MGQQAAFNGFALGRDRSDAPFAFEPVISAEDLLRSSDFEAPGSSQGPSAQLPGEPTVKERSVTVTLPAVIGRGLPLGGRREPIPEPAAHALMLASLAGVLALARRQRRPG